MTVRTFPVGAASGGPAAYEQRRRDTAPAEAPAVATGRKERSFSLGPFTLRYEEEESVDFSALASAARAQVDRVRRFNFVEALQTENARAELFSAAPTETDPAAAPTGYQAVNPLAALAARAAEELTYDADGRVRQPQLYIYPSGRPDQAASGSAAETSGSSATTARTREALTAYLAAERTVMVAPRTGRLVSGQV